MSAPVTVSTVDSILAVQLMVAWAGDSREMTKRLGWWHTDLIDSTGGGDFLARLLPRTHAWASLEAVREAVRRADEAARRGMADPDQVRTLFFLGFDLDERLAERLAELKRGGQPPASALPFPVTLDAPFSSEKLTEALALGARHAPAYDVVPGGRQLKGAAPAAPKFKLSEGEDRVRRQDDSVDDHAPAVPIDDRSARMPKRRGRT